MLFLGCIFEIIFLISATDVGFKKIELHIGDPKNSLNSFCGVASLFTNFLQILEKDVKVVSLQIRVSKHFTIYYQRGALNDFTFFPFK